MTPTSSSTRRTRFAVLSMLAFVFSCFVLSSVRAAEDQEAPKLRVLILSGLNNHDWRSTTPAIEKMFRDCGRFGTVDVTDTPADLDPSRLAAYDVIVSNWTPYPDVRRTWRPELETTFLEWVRAGGGFVVIHAAACTFQVWPEFQDLIALTWKENYTAHSAYHTFKVSVESPEHPIACGLTDFLTTDELYHNMVPLTDHPRQVVFKAFSAKEQSGTGEYEPIVVCTEVERGRGVNLILGHDAAAMGAGFKTLLLRSAEWAATGNVTIPPPTIWPTTTAALEVSNVDVDQTFELLARYTEGQQRKPLHGLQQLIRYANREDSAAAHALRETLAARMAALFASPNATPESKAFVCGQYPAVATDQQAPVLAALLADKDLADKDLADKDLADTDLADTDLADTALRGLAMIPGVAVDQILREALEKESGIQQIGIVNALGERGDRAAVEAICRLLDSDDELLACAAAGALGKIGGDGAVAALQQRLTSTQGRRREAVTDACLVCADRLLANHQREAAAAVSEQLDRASETEPVRMAAWRGIILAKPEQAVGMICEALISGNGERESMALGLLSEAQGGAAATIQFAACLAKTNPSMQVPLLAALAARRDPAARDAIEAAARSGDATVRLAALKALGVVGGESSVELLVEYALTAVGTPEGDEARGSLVRVPDVRISEALAGMLARRSATEKVELIRILAARNASTVVERLKHMAVDADGAVRLESWKALESVAQETDVRHLLPLLVHVAEAEREVAEAAVVAVLKKAARPDASLVVEQVEVIEVPAARCSLLRILSAVGDDRGLPAMRKNVHSPDATVCDVAIRGLAAWPTPTPLEDLISLARSAPESVHRVLALRGAIRLSRLVPDRSPEQMTKLVGELLSLARETAERKAVLAELGECPTREALQLALQYLDQPELATEAGWAVTQIASAIRDAHRAEAVSALQQIMARHGDVSVRAYAAKALKEIVQPVNLALGAAASSPDGVEPDGASGGDQAAIDGNPGTYWDEVDNADVYCLKVTFREPTAVSSINILWHPFEQHQAKNLDVLCDGTVVAEVRETPCLEHEMFVAFPIVRCTTMELRIPGKNGLVSPAIHEVQIFGDFPLNTPGDNAPRTTEKGS